MKKIFGIIALSAVVGFAAGSYVTAEVTKRLNRENQIVLSGRHHAIVDQVRFIDEQGNLFIEEESVIEVYK
jgi:hypothetical protein